MEKSLEIIWKEGFLKHDALIAPRINNLYQQKSRHILDKFKKMFKINLVAIVVGSFVVLLASFFFGIPVTGILLFLILNTIVAVNRKLLKGLLKIDKSDNSYNYLKSFSDWMQQQLLVNAQMASFYYPLIFLAILLGFWFFNMDGTPMGEALVQKFIMHYPDSYLIFGIPVIGIIGVVLIMILLAFFGRKIYKWDVNLIYGRVFKKLNELLADMEELRA
ncbi:hypothetical protein [Spongiimicrobium sp. 3-5]|uniref:hypothetical protein n=1 Tax=Spongiimicrobium sp. 3-5 TaxID=3332596 RepID=UPI00397EE698